MSLQKKIFARPLALRTIFAFIAILLVFSNIRAGIYSQKPVDTASPLKLCRIIPTNNPTHIVFASDNEQNFLSSNSKLRKLKQNQNANLDEVKQNGRNDTIVVFENGGTIKSYKKDATKLIWSSQIGGNFPYKPFILGENLFFISTNADTQKIKLFSLSLKTGITNWSRSFDKISDESLYGFIHTSDNSALFYREKSLTLLSSDTGETIRQWKTDQPLMSVSANERGGIYSGYFDKSINKTLSASGGEISLERFSVKLIPFKLFADKVGNFYVSDNAGQMYAYQSSLKKFRWKLRLGGRVSGFLDAGENLIVTSLDNFIYMLSDADGKIVWKKRLGGRIVSPPLSVSDTLIAYSYGEPEIVFIDISDGRTVNKIILPEAEFPIDTPIFADGRYIFLTNKNILVYQVQNCEKEI